MKVVLSYVLTPIFFLFFGLFLGIFHPLQFLARNLFGSRAHDHVVAALNFCLMRCLLILGTRLSFKNFTKLPNDSSILFIANHQSMWDIPPIIWKLRNNRPKFIAKASLSRFIPSISYNLKHGGSVTIDRQNSADSKSKIESFAIRANIRKFSMVIYPEGTRSKDGEVKPFKLGGIESIIKVNPNIRVVPIAIKNTGRIDNKGKFNKTLGVKAEFTMLATRHISLENLETDLEKIREEIIHTIRQK